MATTVRRYRPLVRLLRSNLLTLTVAPVVAAVLIQLRVVNAREAQIGPLVLLVAASVVAMYFDQWLWHGWSSWRRYRRGRWIKLEIMAGLLAVVLGFVASLWINNLWLGWPIDLAVLWGLALPFYAEIARRWKLYYFDRSG